MFIKKKDYQEKLDLIEGYKKRKDELQNTIYKLRTEKQNLEDTIALLDERIALLEKNNSNLVDQQMKLIDWIEKIINELGCYEISNKYSVTIPIFRNKHTYGNGCDYDGEFINVSKEIILPEIRIIEMKGDKHE